MGLASILRDQAVVLKGTDHWRCADPMFDWYDWVIPLRVLEGRDPGRSPSHAERIALVRLELDRGGSTTSVCGLLAIDDRAARKLVDEARTGACAYERRTCLVDDCATTFRVTDQRLRFCSATCRKRAHRHAQAAATAA